MFPPRVPRVTCFGGVAVFENDGVCSLLIRFLSSSKNPACSGGFACAPAITKSAASAANRMGASRNRLRRRLPVGPMTRVIDMLLYRGSRRARMRRRSAAEAVNAPKCSPFIDATRSGSRPSPKGSDPAQFSLTTSLSAVARSFIPRLLARSGPQAVDRSCLPTTVHTNRLGLWKSHGNGPNVATRVELSQRPRDSSTHPWYVHGPSALPEAEVAGLRCDERRHRSQLRGSRWSPERRLLRSPESASAFLS